MVSKCANPSCTRSFRLLGEGRLFQVEIERDEPIPLEGERKPPRIERFWLCPQCAGRMTVGVDHGRTVQVMPLQTSARRAAG